jgi:hypothetical protein
MASNAGQQMQNPQMGMQTQGMMGGQMPLQGGMQGNPGFMPGGTNPNAMPVGGMFGAQQQMNGLFGGQPQMAQPMVGKQMPTNLSQIDPAMLQQLGQANRLAVQSGQASAPRFESQQAYDQYMTQGAGMQPAMGAGIAALGGQIPPRYDGVGDGMNMPKFAPPPYMDSQAPTKGAIGAPMDYGTPRMQSDMYQFQQNPNQVDMRPTNMQQQQSAPPLPGAGVPPGYRPTNGAIDGRHLRDMMDITRRRPMDTSIRPWDRDENRLPGAISNDLPPSLKRPTQGNYKNFK